MQSLNTQRQRKTQKTQIQPDTTPRPNLNPALFPNPVTHVVPKKYPGPALYLCCSSSGRVSVSHVICAQTIKHKQGRKGGSSGDDNFENKQ